MKADTFVPDKACRKGHMAPRYVSNNRCCECSRLKFAKYRAANRKKLSEYSKQYSQGKSRKRTPSGLIQCAEYYQRNKDECLRRTKAYRQTHKDQFSNYRRARRARAAAVGGSHTEADIADIFRMQKGCCGYCRTKIPFEQKQVDHITPIARGGHNGRSNLQILCKTCNVRKNAIDPVDYAKRIGRLI